MKVTQTNGVPIVEATAEQMVQLASAVVGAAQHGEAVVRSKGEAIIGFQVVESASSGGVKNDGK